MYRIDVAIAAVQRADDKGAIYAGGCALDLSGDG